MSSESHFGDRVRRPQLPTTLQIGDTTLEVQAYTQAGRWDPKRQVFQGVAGTAWASLDCSGLPWKMVELSPLGTHSVTYSLEVVTRVTNPQTQIALAQAQRIQPGVKASETLHLRLALDARDLARITAGEVSVGDWLEQSTPRGQILVGFEKVTIAPVLRSGKGKITAGKALYPWKPRIPSVLKLELAGFTLILDSLVLAPDGAHGDLTVELPGSLADQKTCTPAQLAVGPVAISPRCALYVEAPEAEFGPWVVGDSGLVVSGSGYTLDLSLGQSPPGKSPAWRGLILHSGQASGAGLIPDPANTGYLGGQYAFTNAEVSPDGLQAHLALSEPHSFQALNPLGYQLYLEAGWLDLVDSQVSGGEFGPGKIDLPLNAACLDLPGKTVSAAFNQLSVNSHLDLVGEVDLAAGLRLAWGELTHAGAEVVAWALAARQGFFYLPANPLASFYPIEAGGFLDLWLGSDPGASLALLEAHEMAGLTLRNLGDLEVFSPDRPGGSSNPLLIRAVRGWLNVGARGLNGELETVERVDSAELGEPARMGYVGVIPFKGTLFGQDKLNLVAQYADSAAYDSALDGALNIPEPCLINGLEFANMKLTSTAHLVGGDVSLPAGGVTLDYWQLQLVPTGSPSQAGVVSVRTGRILFTSAGISEPVHFAAPFRLIWAEMRADGNLGELFFDYNDYGQRFDDLPYSAQRILLSEYRAGATDAYLATCGTVHFNFFKPRYVNLHDARYHDAAAPYYSRYMTVPKSGEAGCTATDLTLEKDWDDKTGALLAAFSFPDVSMDYYEAQQDGFIGSGTSHLSFLHSDGLDATIEIHASAIDIRLSSLVTHDLDLGLFASVGGISETCGCARIEGEMLTRISLYGLLEHSTSTGASILAPKTGCMAETNLTITPNSIDFMTAGDLLMQVAGSAVDLTARVHFLFDFERATTEGEVIGRIDCNTILGGLEGEGQVTWFSGPTMQYLQGRMKVYLCGWVGSGGLEGGLFIGYNTDRALAWVLHTDSEHFGISDDILPAHLTGLFGYGRLSASIDLFLFGGGYELYAGLGAFSETPPGLSGEWPTDWSSNPGLGLPYVIGSCGLYVHGEILGGLVSASAWADLDLRGPLPIYFEGSFGLEGCVVWVICASVEVTAGFNSSGFYLF